MPSNEELEQQIKQLKQDLENLKSLFFKDNYSDLQIFIKKVQFNSDFKTVGKIGFYNTDPITQQSTFSAPSGGDPIDSEARTAIGDIKTILTNLGLTT